VQGCIQARV